ncbi:MAG TPA: hypothetical protein VHU80_21135 [Polyangiaceae bacterium]|jgi:hypothetical protein|nr:hypothetical protein [Polyangiaceae bacterium]
MGAGGSSSLVGAGGAGIGAGATVSGTGATGSTAVGTGGTTTTFPGGGGSTTIVTGTGGSSTIGGSTGGSVGTGSGGGSTGGGGISGTGGGAPSGGMSVGGSSGAAGASGGAAGSAGKGMCCASGDCLCHGPDPTAPTSANGPYKTAMFTMSTGTVYYPTDAEPPLAGVSICPGFLNTGPEMAPWGPFYASWGIVCVVTSTGAADAPNVRGQKLVAAIQELKTQGTMSSSPLNGKLAGRYGTSGYSMGGGGTTFASEADTTLKTSVGLAAWGPDGATVKTPTLFICSDADTVASCSGTNTSYAAIPASVPKMILDIPGESHFNWFSPTDAGMGESGAYALAFQKVFLEGDERWKPILSTMPKTGTTKMANVQ